VFFHRVSDSGADIRFQVTQIINGFGGKDDFVFHSGYIVAGNGPGRKSNLKSGWETLIGLPSLGLNEQANVKFSRRAVNQRHLRGRMTVDLTTRSLGRRVSAVGPLCQPAIRATGA
jgi:hypothetical protein